MSKCNKENMTAWIEALRSKRYERCSSVLKTTAFFKCLELTAYCPLGVLEELAGQPIYFYQKFPKCSTLTNWLGLQPQNIKHVNVDGVEYADLVFEDGMFMTNLNDSMKYSFEETADKLEREFLTDANI